MSLDVKKLFFISTLATLWLWTPSSFANNQPIIANTELSADSFIRFKDNVNMRCRNPSDLSKVNTVLGAGSVIQLPRGITEYNDGLGGDSGIDFNKTIDNWKAKSQSDPMYHSHRPLYRQCSNNRDECPEVDSSEPYLPIKVAKSSDPNFDVNSTGSICYVALDYIKRNIDASRYQTVRTNLQSALALNSDSDNKDVIAPQVFPEEDQGLDLDEDSEVTSSVPSSPRPQLRPESLSAPYEGFRCRQSSYQRVGYGKSNCFAKAKLGLNQKAEIVMKDVIEINRRRNGIKVDPRFSACVAYKESKFAPNAKGGHPDYGMFQVINDTARRSLSQTPPVTPGFERYRHRWAGTSSDPGYREAMLNSTLAQADLHHSVLTGMVKWKNHAWSGFFNRFYRGQANRTDYLSLAGVYNRGGNYSRGQKNCYNKAVIGCFDRMKSAATSAGKITSSTNLKNALNYAARRCPQ